VISVLVVDDEPGGRVSLGIALHRAGFAVGEAGSVKEARERLEVRSHDAVVADCRMGDGTGLDLLRWVRRRGTPECFVMITAYGTIPLAVEAMSDGASHFLAKPVEPEAIVALLRQRISPRPPLAGASGLPSWLVAVSPRMLECLARARDAATARSPVLITGPTGAGKEVVARYLHEASPRRERPFVAVNCTAVASNLFESEFFGHVRGAYTGAADEAPGLFREADGGTLPLDEVAELSPEMQAKLLRAVETAEVRPVGASSPERVEVRIVASTNRDARRAVSEGRLREDLYYRLSGTSIAVPSLAERPEDVLPLAARFIDEFCRLYGKPPATLAPDASDALRGHRWPGNVRELRHAIERGVNATRSTRIAAADLALDAPAGTAPRGLDAIEREHILWMLQECAHNKA
jgi:DNA-binding NtrC family response regulator